MNAGPAPGEAGDKARGPIRTTCPYCGVGCGVLATATAAGATIAGDPRHPANFGRLCSKGTALGETLSLDDRLMEPRIAGAIVSWDRALDQVARRFTETIAAHGPDSVAFYVSGQLLTEDYYVANKLMKGFIGAANIDTNSRLCMASSVAGHRRAFGADTVPGTYEDLEEADLVVLVGSNLAWCHPILYQRLAAAREARGTFVVVIDPRTTATCDIADQHLRLAPGTDVALFNGLLAYCARDGRLDRTTIDRHTTGFGAAIEVAKAFDIADVAAAAGVSSADIAAFYARFVATERVVTVYSQGVNQSCAGTDKVNAIVNCHLATGRIGRAGMGPFSVTGQPNAMGGREVGGLANMLAAHMEIESPDHRRIVGDFWRAPRLATRPGLKAVDLFHAVEDGRVKAIWIMGTNPVVSMPDADRVRRALESCPFVVVSEVCAQTDTSALAHVLLPSLAWGEKDGTVTNSERRISRQRPFLPAPGQAMADWRQMAEVARRMGFGAGFDYRTAADVFREYAALTGIENDGRRDLDISGVAAIDDEAYDELAPFQWPRRSAEATTTRFFAEGGYYHADGKARFVATPFRAPASSVSPDRPLALNTGRIRDQWHTMTRTGKVPRLTAHIGEPFVQVHPADARRLGIDATDIAIVETDRARVLLRVIVTDEVSEGALFAPMHWNDRFASAARVGALIGDARDPVSGQPELKFTPASARRFEAVWFGFAVAARRPVFEGVDYAALAPTKGGFRAELAGAVGLEDAEAAARGWLGIGPEAEVVSYHDRVRGQFRLAAFEVDRLIGVLFLAPEPVAVARADLSGRLAATMDGSGRLALLAGRVGDGQTDKGAIVCACFEVGRADIRRAAEAGARTVAAIGVATSAGTNCGSCRGEITRMLAAREPVAVGEMA